MSSMYSQKNCSTSTNSVMKNVAIKGPTNALMMSRSSFFIIFIPMNAAKVQFSPGDNQFPEGGGPPIYHKIRSAWMVSPEEMGLVANEALILTKNAIIAKSVALMAALSEKMRPVTTFPPFDSSSSPGSGPDPGPGL